MYCVFGIKLKSEVASDMEIAKWRPMHSYSYVTVQIYVSDNFNILKCKCYYHFKMPSALFDL